MDRFEKAVPPTRMCLWFEGGDTVRTPYLAFVVEATSREAILELAVLGKSMVAFRLKHGVRHKDDPFLTPRPEHVKDNGFWDYLPDLVPVQPTQPDKPPADPPIPARPEATDSPENRDRVKVLAAEGKSSPEIAITMSEETGETWTHQRIGAMVRQFPSGE